LYVLVK